MYYNLQICVGCDVQTDRTAERRLTIMRAQRGGFCCIHCENTVDVTPACFGRVAKVWGTMKQDWGDTWLQVSLQFQTIGVHRKLLLQHQVAVFFKEGYGPLYQSVNSDKWESWCATYIEMSNMRAACQHRSMLQLDVLMIDSSPRSSPLYATQFDIRKHHRRPSSPLECWRVEIKLLRSKGRISRTAWSKWHRYQFKMEKSTFTENPSNRAIRRRFSAILIKSSSRAVCAVWHERILPHQPRLQ